MIEESIKEEIISKYQELDFENQKEIDCIELFKKFYTNSVDFSYNRLSQLELTTSQKKVVKRQFMSQKQQNELLNSIRAIRTQAEFASYLAIITQSRLAVLRAFARLNKDEELSELLSEGLKIYRMIKSNL